MACQARRSPTIRTTLDSAQDPLGSARRATAVGVAALLAACGGSGGGSGGSGGNATAAAPKTLAVFLASIDAIDPDVPAQIKAIDSSAAPVDPTTNPVGAVSVVAGTANSGLVASAHVKWVLYPRADGTLWRVSTDPVAGTPTPIRVSTEAAALPFCAARRGLDVADPTATQVAYAVGNPTCATALDWRVIALSDDDHTLVRDLAGDALTTIWNPSTGQSRGWLVLDHGIVRHLAPDLTFEAPHLRANVTRAEVLGATTSGTLFVELDQGLYTYDPVQHQLRSLSFDFTRSCSCRTSFTTDGTDAYAIDAGKLYRVNLATTSLAAIDSPNDAVANAVSPLHFVAIGARRVAWSYTNDADSNPATTTDQKLVLRTIERAGTNGIKLDELAPATLPAAITPEFVATASDDWLFYNRTMAGQTSPTAAAARLDGSEFALNVGALWVGDSASTVLPTAEPGRTSRLVRLSRIQDLLNLANNTQLTLATTNPNDPRGVQVLLGVLPAGSQFASAKRGLGPRRLGLLRTPNGLGGLQSDLLFWNEELDSSLLQVTATNGQDEVAGALF